MADTKKIPERAEVREEDKWAIHDIYATDELWEADLEKAKQYSDMLINTETISMKLQLISDGKTADEILAVFYSAKLENA